MSTSAMTPPRVSQRIGQVGLPAPYSPGQAKVNVLTVLMPKWTAICIERTRSSNSLRKAGSSCMVSRSRSARWSCLKGAPAAMTCSSSPCLATRAAIRPASGIAHLGDGWLIGNAGEPHGVGADLLGASEAFVKRQPQLGQKHP